MRSYTLSALALIAFKMALAQIPPEIAETLQSLADGFRTWPNSPIYHWPHEESLEFETVFFPSEDGVQLEGWFIPCNGSNKIIVANHPRWFNRAGLPAHLEPWKQLGGPGNDFDVNFIPDYKILHDAGYNILAYDLRNFGHSGNANGGLFSVGRYESRDVIGALNYVRSRDDTRNMIIGLFSRCVGANASFMAMMRRPMDFEDVRCMVAPQPLSAGVSLQRIVESLNISTEYMDDLEEMVYLQTSLTFEELSPVSWARSVKVPTFLYQVRDDWITLPSDVQAMYDNLPLDREEKQLRWIENSTNRWDGYVYFQKEPQQFLDWFERFMGA